MSVQALYVDPRGPYPELLGAANCWDESRDAKLYAGPWPVVAHPPCGPWGRLSHFSKQDASCGPSAVRSVRTFGGVLEHPANSRLWDYCLLPRPGELPDEFGGASIAVDQCAYGHVARKPTWVYVVGAAPPVVRQGGNPTHSVCNGRGQRLADGTQRKRCTSFQARATPVEFAMFLIGLAERCVK